MNKMQIRDKWLPVIQGKFFCNQSLLLCFVDDLAESLNEIDKYEVNIAETGKYIVSFMNKVLDYFKEHSNRYLIEFNDFSIRDNEMLPVFQFEKTGYNPLTGEILYYMNGDWFDYKHVSETLNQKFIKETKFLEFIRHECKMITDKAYKRSIKLNKIN